jgi:glycosyltransferase involved in cell wall biosynthesis
MHEDHRAFEEEIGTLRERLRQLEGLLSRFRGQVAEKEVVLRLTIAQLEAERRTLEEALATSEGRRAAAEDAAREWERRFQTVVRSKSYRLTEPLRRLALGLPVLRRGLRWAQSAIPATLWRVGRRWLPTSVRRWLRIVAQRPSFTLWRAHPYQIVRVYTTRTDWYPTYPHRVLMESTPRHRRPVSLVATVKNESRTIARWLESIHAQTRRPDEIIVVDGGSTDDTVDVIREFAEKFGLPIRILVVPGINIARGRNVAIAQARHDVVAVTDAGCVLDPRWLEFITLPFDAHPDTEFVAGLYAPICETLFQRVVARFAVPRAEEIDPVRYSPSSRSVAFTKGLWEAVGGYPEYLTKTAEDTLFNVRAKARAMEWAHVPEAVVYWPVPGSLAQVFRTYRGYGAGDGEADLYGPTYGKLAVAYGVAAFGLVTAVLVALVWELWLAVLSCAALIPWVAVLWHYGVWRGVPGGWRTRLWAVVVLSAIHLGQVVGYASGLRRRRWVQARRFEGVTHNFLLLAGIPFFDTGGGQRSTQLAWEFLRRGCTVTYVNRFPSYETRPLRVRYGHPLLECMAFREFDPNRYARECGPVLSRTVVLVEFPLPEYVRVARMLKQRGATIVYDLMDKWDSALGGEWYAPDVEDELIRLSDVLVATSRQLQARLQQRAHGRRVLLLPNAVNLRLFDLGKDYARPRDLPQGPVVGYVGSMYGGWFREDLVLRVAEAYPDVAVVMVGDARDRFRQRPSNLYVLGLKPHAEVPAYVRYFDVCIIPFDRSPLVEATSPLKVYEYLAMGKPVVATRMQELVGMPGVRMADGDEQFVAEVGRALKDPGGEEMRGALLAFVRQHSWEVRVNVLLDALATAVRGDAIVGR